MRNRLVAVIPALILILGGCEGGSDPPVAIQNVTVVPATGDGRLADHTVVIEGDRIRSVAPSGTVDLPPGARVVDGRGKFLIPGLVEMHGHISKARSSALGLFVVHGVTTVRDMGGDHQELLGWRREVRAGERTGPRILLAGPYLESAENIERMRRDPPEERVEPFERARIPVGSPEDARRVVDSLANLELDFLKIRTVADRATYRALNEAADAHGLPLVGHAYGIPPELVLDAGQDGIEHFLFPLLDSLSAEERGEIWTRFAEEGVAVVPTLVTFPESALAPLEELRTMMDDSMGAVEPRRRYVSRFMELDWREQLGEREENEEALELFRHLYRSTVRNLREMHAAGVRLLTGSDVAVLNIFPGSSLHDELELFVDELGLTPQETLQRATRLPAEFLGIADSVGTIEEGKVADLVLLDADPLADIGNTRRIEAVVLRGRLFTAEDLTALLDEVERAPDQQVNDWQR